MPVNIGITFAVGGTLGWIAVKLLRPLPHLQDLIIAMCATGTYIYIHHSFYLSICMYACINGENFINLGNLGNILLIIIPAMCGEEGNPFGDTTACRTAGLSYVSFSMAVCTLHV